MELSRRRFLTFIGAAGGTVVLNPSLGFLAEAGAAGPGSGFLTGGATPLRLPHQLPAYVGKPSYLPTSGTTGTVGSYKSPIGSYQTFDDVIVPPEFERYVIVAWGDRIFPSPADYVGYNADFVGFVPTSNGFGYLWVNHEYVGFPIAKATPEAPASLQAAPVQTSAPLVLGVDLDALPQQERWGEFLYNMGGSVVYIGEQASGRWKALANAYNRRYHMLSGLSLNSGRSDLRPDGTPYSTISSWGVAAHQTGNTEYLVGTGPAATDVFPSSSDGLGNQIIGTGFNCSGGTTPWGTIISCEENFQASPGAFFIGVQENVDAAGHQTGYSVGNAADPATYTSGALFGQVGEKYGWAVEVDPRDPGFRARKHTALGRFRHENLGINAIKGKKLVVYSGDDRRGGHVWKYVSNGLVKGPSKRDENSALFEDGTLYVAQFAADGTGTWIPLALSTPVSPTAPSDLASVEAAERGVAVATITAAKLRLPKRNGIAGQTSDGGPFDVTVANEAASLPDYVTKAGTIPAGATVGDYYANLGAALCDAFHVGNLIGGTPCGRPEDIEVRPGTPTKVFISMTDGAPGSDGYPDSRIFVTGKYTTTATDTQPGGGLYRITEGSADSTGTTFTWSVYAQGGEAGSDGGDGFAAVDTLVFDGASNLWGVTDMSTAAHNGFNLTYAGATLQPGQTAIAHNQTGSFGSIYGVYGNNWMFYVPTVGANAGRVMPFAYGPPRCEMTAPMFVGDTLMISVQHPGEDSPINGDPGAGGVPASTISRNIELLDLNGNTYNQLRTVPRGSNWPSHLPVADGGSANPTGPPKPSVIGIRRKP